MARGTCTLDPHFNQLRAHRYQDLTRRIDLGLKCAVLCLVPFHAFLDDLLVLTLQEVLLPVPELLKLGVLLLDWSGTLRICGGASVTCL